MTLDLSKDLIAKVSITLTSSDSWLLWYNHIQTLATTQQVWHLINPELSEEPSLPLAPIRPKVEDIDSMCHHLAQLKKEQLDLWSNLRREYELDLREYERIINRINFIHQLITTSISHENRRLIGNNTSVYTILKILYQLHAPTTESRKRHVIKQWHQMRQGPRSMTIESWLTKWENIYTEAIQLNIGEVIEPERPLYDFLDAVASLSPYFMEHWHNTLLSMTEQGKELPTFFYLIKRYRDSIRLNPIRNPPKITHATFQGENDQRKKDHFQDQKQTGEQTKSQYKRNKRSSCPCEEDPYNGYHYFKDCYYINSAKRPANWKPSKEAKQRFQSACENERFKAAYDKATKEFSSEALLSDQSSDKIREHHSCLSIQAYQTQAHQPYQIQSYQKKRKNDIWAFDTASDTHICNDRSLFTSYQSKSSEVYVGDTLTKIQGYGTVLLYPTESADKKPFELKNCAFAPGFHLNLLSASLAEKAGIYYHGRRHCLENEIGEPICFTKHKSGLYLIKWDESTDTGLKEEKTTIENKANTIQSAKPHITKGSMELWHQRLGHPNKEVLKHLETATTGISIDLNSTYGSCDTCNKSKAKCQISRRPIHIGDKPFETLHWDLIHMTKAYNHAQYISHLICPVTKYNLSSNISRKDQISETLKAKIAFIET